MGEPLARTPVFVPHLGTPTLRCLHLKRTDPTNLWKLFINSLFQLMSTILYRWTSLNCQRELWGSERSFSAQSTHSFWYALPSGYHFITREFQYVFWCIIEPGNGEWQCCIFETSLSWDRSLPIPRGSGLCTKLIDSNDTKLMCVHGGNVVGSKGRCHMQFAARIASTQSPCN